MDGPIVSARVGENGPVVMIAVAGETSPERDVAIGRVLSFDGLTKSIGAVAESMTHALRAAKPSEAEVEFGVDVGIEPGELTALIVKGTGTATLRIKLTWRDATSDSTA
jgi:Trypsin-co-occurring domain 1